MRGARGARGAREPHAEVGKRACASYTLPVVRTGLVIVSLTGILALARDPGCGGADSSESALNAPCTRSKDCSAGLVCAEGVCADPDGGAVRLDGGADATTTVDASNDGG